MSDPLSTFLNEKSNLYSFKPDVLIILPDYRDVKDTPSIFSEYDQIEVGYKTNDSRYIVLSISGGIIYDTNVENCYPKKKEIIKKLSQILKNTDWKITIYEDDKVFFFNDINPQAKIHILAIPKMPVTDFNDFVSL